MLNWIKVGEKEATHFMAGTVVTLLSATAGLAHPLPESVLYLISSGAVGIAWLAGLAGPYDEGE